LRFRRRRGYAKRETKEQKGGGEMRALGWQREGCGRTSGEGGEGETGGRARRVSGVVGTPKIASRYDDARSGPILDFSQFASSKAAEQ